MVGSGYFDESVCGQRKKKKIDEFFCAGLPE